MYIKSLEIFPGAYVCDITCVKYPSKKLFYNAFNILTVKK